MTISEYVESSTKASGVPLKVVDQTKIAQLALLVTTNGLRYELGQNATRSNES
jgi:hypothetical protein